ncbi:uncharacterized protein LOC126051587 isoform X1 [Accipiter gentilis]|uniref:uncharacterized protein LOC126051587 isoform X1 n=1 Tax=Astur gentilis TaxID=8957 RepID=UPI0021103A6D|nr:uncharacterized protein LOC126051587 isoform X1 [Accipiter gentilis]
MLLPCSFGDSQLNCWRILGAVVGFIQPLETIYPHAPCLVGSILWIFPFQKEGDTSDVGSAYRSFIRQEKSDVSPARRAQTGRAIAGAAPGARVGHDEAPRRLVLGGDAAARPLQRFRRQPPRCRRENRRARRRRRRRRRGAAGGLSGRLPRRWHPRPWLEGGRGHRGRRRCGVRHGASGAPAAIPPGSRCPGGPAAPAGGRFSRPELAGHGCQAGTPKPSLRGPAWWHRSRSAAGARRLLRQPRAAALSTRRGPRVTPRPAEPAGIS